MVAKIAEVLTDFQSTILDWESKNIETEKELFEKLVSLKDRLVEALNEQAAEFIPDEA